MMVICKHDVRVLDLLPEPLFKKGEKYEYIKEKNRGNKTVYRFPKPEWEFMHDGIIIHEDELKSWFKPVITLSRFINIL